MNVEDLLTTLKEVPDKNVSLTTFGGKVVQIQFYDSIVILRTACKNKYLTVRQCAQKLLNCGPKQNVYIRITGSPFIAKLRHLDFNDSKFNY